MTPAETKLLAESSLQPARQTSPDDPATGGARLRQLYATIRSSPWLPIVARSTAIVAFMLGFAAVGAVSSWIQPPGVHLASQMSPTGPLLWLAPTPSASASSHSSKPEAPAPAPPAEPKPQPKAVRVAASCNAAGGACEGHAKQEAPEGVTSDGKVILNVASAEVLTRLPGVGPRRAEAIVALRERLKGFKRTTDLLRVRGIGVKSLKRMLPHLVLDPPTPEDNKSPDAPLTL